MTTGSKTIIQRQSRQWLKPLPERKQAVWSMSELVEGKERQLTIILLMKTHWYATPCLQNIDWGSVCAGCPLAPVALLICTLQGTGRKKEKQPCSESFFWELPGCTLTLLIGPGVCLSVSSMSIICRGGSGFPSPRAKPSPIRTALHLCGRAVLKAAGKQVDKWVWRFWLSVFAGRLLTYRTSLAISPRKKWAVMNFITWREHITRSRMIMYGTSSCITE